MCEYGKKERTGLSVYIKCEKTNSPCYFQRYCQNERTVIFTEGSMNCRLKNEKVVDNQDL